MYSVVLSLADPLPLAPTLRCETDGGAWPLAKVNRALNCVWALHHTPTAAEIKHCSSPSSHWQLSANYTVSLLLSLARLPWTVSSPQQTWSDSAPNVKLPSVNQYEPSHNHYTFRSWLFEPGDWWCLTNSRVRTVVLFSSSVKLLLSIWKLFNHTNILFCMYFSWRYYHDLI